MRKTYCLLLAFLFLISCASKNVTTQKKIEIAMATQKVGEEYYNAGHYTAALKKLLEAYKTIPDDPYLHNSLGLVYLAKERYNLAEKHFKTALNFKTDYVNAKNNLGATYLKQKKWDLAVKCFQEVSDNLLYATPERPLSNLGWVYYHQQMYKLAKSYFNKALDVHPDFLIAIHGISSLYIKTGYHAKAITFLHYKLKTNPGAAILHSDLAKAYEGLKDYNQAKRSWELVLRLVPSTSPLAREAQVKLLQLN
ncbi:tetratricopeptide repeat protein [Desulfobacterales bacterium HSG17]|nr:tetratricopeptide repeat protein [Desulfobacterales bacterium HSG17]